MNRYFTEMERYNEEIFNLKSGKQETMSYYFNWQN